MGLADSTNLNNLQFVALEVNFSFTQMVFWQVTHDINSQSNTC